MRILGADSGSVAEWVTGIVTAVAVMVTAWALVAELSYRRRQDERSDLHTARQVDLSPTVSAPKVNTPSGEPGYGTAQYVWLWKFTIVNRSGETIRFVHFRCEIDDKPYAFEWPFLTHEERVDCTAHSGVLRERPAPEDPRPLRPRGRLTHVDERGNVFERDLETLRTRLVPVDTSKGRRRRAVGEWLIRWSDRQRSSTG